MSFGMQNQNWKHIRKTALLLSTEIMGNSLASSFTIRYLALSYLTDIQGYDEDHLAWLYNKASLHAIDRFFMQVRRRLSLLERPISSSASLGCRWFGYGPYKPVMVGKLLDIFRVFYNFVEVGKNK